MPNSHEDSYLAYGQLMGSHTYHQKTNCLERTEKNEREGFDTWPNLRETLQRHHKRLELSVCKVRCCHRQISSINPDHRHYYGHATSHPRLEAYCTRPPLAYSRSS